ncbi:MAG: hypothetical protein QGG64_03685 [Candidatus Latescibacteria bacterium]|jgi:hypothetical protein|nr:hypothetical protein [Candidatus Latescibacterota bacterium]
MEETETGIGHQLAYFACWMIAMVLAFLSLVSARELGLSVLAVSEVDVKVVALIDKVGFFGFGVVGLTVIILAEGYFRTGVKNGQLVERIGLVFGVELLGLFVFDGARLLMPGIIDAARPGVIQTFLHLAIGGLCLGLYHRQKKIRQ